MTAPVPRAVGLPWTARMATRTFDQLERDLDGVRLDFLASPITILPPVVPVAWMVAGAAFWAMTWAPTRFRLELRDGQLVRRALTVRGRWAARVCDGWPAEGIQVPLAQLREVEVTGRRCRPGDGARPDTTRAMPRW